MYSLNSFEFKFGGYSDIYEQSGKFVLNPHKRTFCQSAQKELLFSREQLTRSLEIKSVLAVVVPLFRAAKILPYFLARYGVIKTELQSIHAYFWNINVLLHCLSEQLRMLRYYAMLVFCRNNLKVLTGSGSSSHKCKEINVQVCKDEKLRG